MQAACDAEFLWRKYVSHYRVFDGYKRSMASFAVLRGTDEGIPRKRLRAEAGELLDGERVFA